LLALGFDTNLIVKVAAQGHTIDALRKLSRDALKLGYAEDEIELIQQKIKRQPIDADVLDRVISLADESCCFCADGNRTRPYQIHHAEEYAHTQDNSEDNLILVCPTHHQSAPKQHSPSEQKAVRRRWQAVVQIAREYRDRGIDFPFGSFVAKDFTLPARPEELVDGYRVSSSTALACAHHDLADEGLAKVRERGFLAIVGASGDGKTTLAIGIAGRLSQQGYRVLSYQPSMGGKNALSDVLTFLGMIERPCVLVIDDANRLFSETHLSEIAAAVRGSVLVIATWTRDRLAEDPRPERHLPGWLLVSWERLRLSIRDYLIANEPAVVNAIRRYRDPRDPERIGLGAHDTSLSLHIRNFEVKAKTTSELLFLLRGGAHVVRDEIDTLVRESRSDVPVLFAAIEQIAGFERPVTPEEAAAACPSPNEGSRLPAATADWVRDVFETQCRRGRMQESRGAFTTIHRDWAARLIGAGLASTAARPESEGFLLANLDLLGDPARVTRLSSWLWFNEHGGPFVREWLARQSDENWTVLVGNAAAASLETVGHVADRMHILFRRPTWEQTVAKAFSAHEESLRGVIRGAGPDDWYALQRLAFAIDYASPDLSARLWASWDPMSAAAVIARTHPDSYDAATWFFSSVKKINPTWVSEVGTHISWQAVSKRLDDVRSGDLDAVFQCQNLLLQLGVPLRRSMVRRYAEAMESAVSRTHLADLHVGISHIDWTFIFPDELRRVVSKLDPARLANELSHSRPREWRALIELAALTENWARSFFSDVIDHIDSDALCDAVRTQAVNCEYELRCLLWILAHGRNARARQIAERLYPEISAACSRSSVERPQLIRALQSLHWDLAARLMKEFSSSELELRELKKHDRDWIGLDVRKKMAQLRSKCAEFETTGKDFVIDLQTCEIVGVE
jgi:hypothetical protein